MATVRITNTRTSLLRIPAIDGSDSIALMPGETEIDSKQFEAIKKSKAYEAWVNEGYITGDGIKATRTGDQQVEGATDYELAKLTVGDVEDRVMDEEDIATLNRWRQSETRKGAQTAIDRRIAELEQE